MRTTHQRHTCIKPKIPNSAQDTCEAKLSAQRCCFITVPPKLVGGYISMWDGMCTHCPALTGELPTPPSLQLKIPFLCGHNISSDRPACAVGHPRGPRLQQTLLSCQALKPTLPVGKRGGGAALQLLPGGGQHETQSFVEDGAQDEDRGGVHVCWERGDCYSRPGRAARAAPPLHTPPCFGSTELHSSDRTLCVIVRGNSLRQSRTR